MLVRCIYYGGARERNSDGSTNTKGINDNSAFKFAALNIVNSYRSLGDEIIVKKISTAAEIVSFLESKADASIASLDIISHGSPLSLNFSLKPYESCGFYASWLGKKAVESYYSDRGGDYKFGMQSRSVSDIPWKCFTNNAKIQMHGCLTASDWFRSNDDREIFPIIVDNLVENISDELTSAGKTNALVIGHTTRGNPLINGSKTSLSQQDYRHGERKIYNKGKSVLTTREKGHLSDDYLKRSIQGWPQ